MNSPQGVSWPDWSGETAIIVGTGPSANQVWLHCLKDRSRIIAIKSSWQLVPWADALYGVDRGWWVANRGAVGFKGLKFCPSPSVCKVYRIRLITLKARAEILTKHKGVIGCGLTIGGGFSGFQAINLAVQFGARRIVLVGFDMTLAGGAHWHSEVYGSEKPNADRTEMWRKALDGCAQQFAELGIEVLNASPKSALQSYRKVNLDELISLVSLPLAAHSDHSVRGGGDCVAAEIHGGDA